MHFWIGSSREHNSTAGRYHLWLAPFFAFVGLAILIAFHGKAWEYSLPFGERAETNSQTLWIKTDLLRGIVLAPKAAQIHAPVTVGGRFGSVDPNLQLQNITVYIDGTPVGESEAFYPVLVNLNGQSPSIKSWRVDFFLKNMQPGYHVLALLAVPQGHEPIPLIQTTILVFR